MTRDEEIAAEISTKSEDELLSIIAEGYGAGDPYSFRRHVAATRQMHQLRLARESNNQKQLLAGMVRPHNMRDVPDWWIQISWWASSIFATGAVWYFLSTRAYCFAVTAGLAAVLFAVIAITLHRKKDSLLSTVPAAPQVPQTRVEKDKTVNAQWWDASDLRKEYEGRGLSTFCWSTADRVPEREQQGYEVVYLEDDAANTRYRIVNKSGQVLIAKS